MHCFTSSKARTRNGIYNEHSERISSSFKREKGSYYTQLKAVPGNVIYYLWNRFFMSEVISSFSGCWGGCFLLAPCRISSTVSRTPTQMWKKKTKTTPRDRGEINSRDVWSQNYECTILEEVSKEGMQICLSWKHSELTAKIHIWLYFPLTFINNRHVKKQSLTSWKTNGNSKFEQSRFEGWVVIAKGTGGRKSLQHLTLFLSQICW